MVPKEPGILDWTYKATGTLYVFIVLAEIEPAWHEELCPMLLTGTYWFVANAVVIAICDGAVFRVMNGLPAFPVDTAERLYLLLYVSPCEVQYVLAE